ncbi:MULTISPECIES: glycerol kinase GlpK [unclassified Paenibacillus]|uniref:glycerol kinase GlpK n=1 Tax=unclassified Paenibacillus TaxID=185978 RepID=UPI002404AE35|nr:MULTISPECIES: glycerol kinase GlpK [unclassified Paenibacillus]MDF9840361.1 glycerol kinase [Paenibacillus sp. PastF-2]MDF9846943.1 glycerol kinase [Paenibacillus sp. PastM-2]MDF9853515.1 glycerol kinase [Paenibacillus sp. PastF-1]MDH6478999.1 glycerol kinase [Paenibacillus sp. PastH-2]MDH6506731.1 glycerol kinase [Paenibacillus sp. PastM-3]
MILSLDQGTTSSRAILFNLEAGMVAQGQHEIKQFFPRPGWVEHDPEQIWESQLAAARDAIQASGIAAEDITAIGITNQRETALIWDRTTGEPIYPAIVWQDRRTAQQCEEIKRQGLDREIADKTGLVVDAYFSATKLAWILDHVQGARERAERGELLAGTIDSWLIWKLTGGAVHATDVTNASRTMLFNLHERRWDDQLIQKLRIPRSILPEIRMSGGEFGIADAGWFGAAIPICSVLGDQQAALFGHTCLEAGSAKNTYGTGCFILMNTGTEAVVSNHGLLTTVAWGMGDELYYALEGSVFVAGAAVQWLHEGLGLIEGPADSEQRAAEVEDSEGVVVVPAFTGLGAPYWDMYARGAVFGLTRGTTAGHLVRATLEALAFQSRDVIGAMEKDAGMPLTGLRVDGGAVRNNLLMQFQADILGSTVTRTTYAETTALGAALLAGLTSGVWSREQLESFNKAERDFVPRMDGEERERRYSIWQDAVERSMGWEKHEPRN